MSSVPPSMGSGTGMLLERSSGVLLDNCKFVNCGIGIHSIGSSVNLIDTDFENCGTGVLQEGGVLHTKNVKIQGTEES
ncbi:MAG TPA: hypothetical protein VII60_01660 [Acidimicrobiales bacterium]